MVGDTILAAALLSIERLAYIGIARRPHVFRRLVAPLAPEPVDAVRGLFYAFKVVQIGVFAWWITRGAPPAIGTVPAAVVAGLAIGLVGQTLNAMVFKRLGPAGTFYGAEFGMALPRVEAFPFSWIRHPQYVGTVLSIWGAFLALRAPHPDWWVLPAIETAFYAAGATLEEGGGYGRDIPR